MTESRPGTLPLFLDPAREPSAWRSRRRTWRSRRMGRGRRPSLAATLVLAGLLGSGVAGCEGTGTQGEVGLTDTGSQVVQSEHGAVAAASIWAAEVGARILAEGGNAADAAVATGWALAVTEPSMSGIGGRASITIRTADGRVEGIDGLNQVPHGYQEGVAPGGYDRAAIPGVPAALARLHAEHGSLPMARLLEPAIRLAEEGFELPEPEADRFAGAAEDLLAFSPGSAMETYLQPDGTPWPAGTLFRQPQLARVLRAMAEEGVEVFYSGWVADSIDADMRRRNAFVTREEMEGYQALRALPVEGVYRGHRILSNFRPASGHAVVQALQTLEAATPEGAPGASGGGVMTAEEEARWAALLGQAMGQAIEERGRVVEESEEASARLLTSEEHARARAEELLDPAALVVAQASGSDVGGGVLSGGWAGGTAAPGASGASGRSLEGTLVALGPVERPGTLVTDARDRESTTHMTVVDRNGMVVALTQSLGPSMGARVVAPGLGFLYATRLGAVPGSRPGSTIAPTVVLRPDGTLLVGLGGAGDARILSAVIQTISRMVDHGMVLDQAVAAPRVHPDGAMRLRVEEGSVGAFTAEQQALLEEWGFELIPSPSSYFGRVHAVGWAPGAGAGAGQAFGVAEPRWNGSAVAPLR